MNYWLYTENYPDEGIEDGTWGIFIVDIVEDPDGEEVDQAKVLKIIYDDTGYMSIGDQEDIFDDSITNDPERILKFLFDQEFWG